MLYPFPDHSISFLPGTWPLHKCLELLIELHHQRMPWCTNLPESWIDQNKVHFAQASWYVASAIYELVSVKLCNSTL